MEVSICRPVRQLLSICRPKWALICHPIQRDFSVNCLSLTSITETYVRKCCLAPCLYLWHDTRLLFFFFSTLSILSLTLVHTRPSFLLLNFKFIEILAMSEIGHGLYLFSDRATRHFFFSTTYFLAFGSCALPFSFRSSPFL